MRLWLIEILSEDGTKWIPMYNPCYSAQEADKKAKVKIRIFGPGRVRVCTYTRDDREVRTYYGTR